ncbi:MAG: gluconate 2-dehydrogenase subunit 3 family protein [Chitinophagaceae bacterium]|nr:gluconate 2-dehydrogenase subunit 3 family protein [Chitinophagaceae bacterium]
MHRREAVQYITLLLGGTLIGGEALLTGCKTKTGGPKVYSADDIAYLNEIADTILPATSTPGAKAANVGQFMTTMVNDSYTDEDQKVFNDGMDNLNKEANKQFKDDFMKLNPQQRHDLLVRLDKEQKDYMKNKKKEQPGHYFRMMKELTLLGYFTSEVGCTKARRYTPVPGRFDGCIPYKKGDKSFA